MSASGIRADATARVAAVRVMHVVYSLQPGGMEHGVVKVVNGLQRSAVRSAICATVPGGPLRTLVDPQVPVFELRRRRGNDPALVWRLYRLFRRWRPDIVHTHAWGTLCEALLAARLARVPQVVHGEHGTLQTRPYQLRIQRFAWGRVDRVLAVSSRLAEKMAAATGFPVERIHVVRNGVDVWRFRSVTREAARRVLGVPPSAVVVGTAGRLVAVKDHGTLIAALARLAAMDVPVVALVAGEGPLQPALEEQARALGIADRVRFLGHRPDIERVLAALDIFVLPSVSEGLSNTILEAMATGVPVVATRVGGADELVEEPRTGMLVPPRDPDALAAAVLRLARDEKKRQAAGASARRRAETVFGLERMIREYGDLYLALAREASARREVAVA